MTTCVAVGTTNADIAGLGVILAFAIQGLIALILSASSVILRDSLEENEHISQDERSRYRMIRCGIDKVLSGCSDTQGLSGIALLISALIQHSSLDLYHMHIIYDTVNFTAVSMSAAIVCSFAHPNERRLSRYLGIGIFCTVYLAFCIIFGNRLRHWDWFAPGACYNPQKIAAANAPHPFVDTIYLAFTSGYMYILLFLALVYNAEDSESVYRLYIRLGMARRELNPEVQKRYSTFYRFFILFFACLLQYPLHLYNIVALRASNQHLLKGESENDWGFSQIIALVMVGQTFVECCRAVKDYREQRHELPL